MDFDRVIKRGTAFVFTPTLALIPSYASSLLSFSPTLYLCSIELSVYFSGPTRGFSDVLREPESSDSRAWQLLRLSGIIAVKNSGRFVIAVYREPIVSRIVSQLAP